MRPSDSDKFQIKNLNQEKDFFKIESDQTRQEFSIKKGTIEFDF